jgi:hypothetical protein
MRFVSRECRVALKKAAETATKSANSSCTLDLEVRADGPWIEISPIAADFNPASASRPITKPRCTLGQAFAALEAQNV